MLKAKVVFYTYPDNSYVRISNYIKIIDSEIVRFHLIRGSQNSLIRENG